jgi:hypothetical protein
MLNSVPVAIRAGTAPLPADGRVDKIDDRMNIALIENAEHDVNSDHRGCDKVRLTLE